MSFKFELNQVVRPKFNDRYDGTIVARFEQNNCRAYLVNLKKIGLKLSQAIEGIIVESILPNLEEDSCYLWFSERELLLVSKPISKEINFGRWLSGVDQYSSDNYKRGNSGMEWL